MCVCVRERGRDTQKEKDTHTDMRVSTERHKHSDTERKRRGAYGGLIPCSAPHPLCDSSRNHLVPRLAQVYSGDRKSPSFTGLMCGLNEYDKAVCRGAGI